MRKLLVPFLALFITGCSGGSTSDKDFDENDIQSMIAAVQSDNEFTQQSAAMALGNKGAEAAEAVPVLVNILKNEDEERVVRAEAAKAIGNIGTTDQAAIDALTEMSDYRPDRLIRENSQGALEKLQQ